MNSTKLDYDFAILGGGAAGLSLALAMVRSPLNNARLLIVEKESKTRNDRTWCFWTDEPSPYDAIARRAWQRLAFLSDTISRDWDLAPFRYLMLRGIDFYEYARRALDRPNVTFQQGEGEAQDSEGCARVTVTLPGGGSTVFKASFAFDSRIRPQDVAPRPGFNNLKQHFLGWEVQTSRPVFDPQTVTFFDLRIPQRDGITFHYILPFSPNRALVEYTLFSKEVLPPQEYETALRAHLQALGAGTYHILETEKGIIPMTDAPFPRRLGRYILSIGTRGGRVKPSTGFAFARIQRDSAAIVRSLERHAHPFALRRDPLRFRLHDTVMLEVLAGEPARGRPILSAIFARNPIQRVLRFLDDRSTPLEDLQVMTAHPPGVFLRAIRRLLQRRMHA